ncbi:MAG: class I SAM-dependent methyltransferase [Azonexus sp.]|jgi:SAM-dependent methyltransferase|nr:class I SAM-dependent methyltransferase [Azonexus sp.]
MPDHQPVELEFSRKYDQEHAQYYLDKHRTGIACRLSNWLDQRVARRALQLAGNPREVLDLPCGAGRFWSLLCERPDRVILAADNSADMVAAAQAGQPPEVVARVKKAFQTSAFAIDLADGAVECVFCIRLLHHIESSEHRLTILREFHRVSRDTVILSLWVDGNYKAWKRRRNEERRAGKEGGGEHQNRYLVARQVIEDEFRQAGFAIVGHVDFLPGYAMWRTYVLRKKN